MSRKLRKLLARIFGTYNVQDTTVFYAETVTWRGHTYITKFISKHNPYIDPTTVQLENTDESVD